jgi:hypothetical protein
MIGIIVKTDNYVTKLNQVTNERRTYEEKELRWACRNDLEGCGIGFIHVSSYRGLLDEHENNRDGREDEITGHG